MKKVESSLPRRFDPQLNLEVEREVDYYAKQSSAVTQLITWWLPSAASAPSGDITGVQMGGGL
jgi:hypothetical protein